MKSAGKVGVNVNIVITMAGVGQRFRDAGYQVPKYRIEAHNKSLFEWSMESLAGFSDESNTYYFIVRKEDDSREFIKETCKGMGILHAEVIELDYRTDGQATTALLAEEKWNGADSLLIYNIDTYVESGEMNESQIEGDGFIPCFTAEGTHWSFVKLDEDGKAIEVKEKERISDYCTLGAYYFKTAELYGRLYREYYEEKKGTELGAAEAEKKERYVAPLYNYLISQGGEVRISNVEASKVHVLGTPEELRVFMDEYQK
ncbi:MAG: glycosyltransferase family 2 protein [Lachnospiraceae bacterium]|nr:glycosyltransferase family 2 protein [Lachnospiraceae bacterium]